MTEGLKFDKMDVNTLELRVSNTLSLNEVFAVLEANKIRVHSMRNKTNRLEELFMDLINGKSNHGH